MNILRQHMLSRGGSLNPTAFPEEVFELYSIPAHDRGGPEMVIGAEIGSSKQLVQPGDVLISKIIPHIRRVRVVGPNTGHRQIASGEWIVLRTRAYEPAYLRHFLLSDRFHDQFMNTVAGVGGSLVRARPQFVKAIPAPLPGLEEQRRIAAILDQADAIRTKRRQMLARFDGLRRNIFEESLSHSGTLTRNRMEQLTGLVTKGTTPTSVGFAFESSGVPFVRVQNLQGGSVVLRDDDLFISHETHSSLRRSQILSGDLLLSIAGTIGRGAIVPDGVAEMNCNQAVAIIRLLDERLRSWVLAWLDSQDAHQQMRASTVTGTISNLSLGQIKSLTVPVPDERGLQTFDARHAAVRNGSDLIREAISRDDELFASLQSRAFGGEL